MAESPDKKPSDIEFLESLYGEPLRQATSRAGKTLVIAGLAAIAIVKFNGRYEKTNAFPLIFDHAEEILLWAALIGVFLLVVNFLLKALTDLAREKEAELLVARYLESVRVDAAVRVARAIDDQEPDPREEERPEPDPWWEEVGKVREAAENAVIEKEKRLGLRKKPLLLRRIRVLAEVSAPLIIGLIALFVASQRIVGQ